MPAKSLVISKSAGKNLSKLPFTVHKRTIKALTQIQQNPIKGVKLHGELGEFYKLRMGNYRIVYQFDSDSKTVIVVKIEHRQGVYK